MTSEEKAVQSGAEQVEEREHLAAGQAMPKDVAVDEVKEGDAPVETALGELTLSMFEQGGSVRVRVGNAHNSAEMYEKAFASAEEANNALLDAGVLAREQVKDLAQPAGTGLKLEGTTVEQLEAAGLKRHGSSTL